MITDVIKQQLAGKNNDTLFVVAKGITRKGVMALYNKAYSEYKQNPYTLRKIGTHNIPVSWPMDSIDAVKLQASLPEEEFYWTKKDFDIPVQIASGKLNTESFVRAHASIRNHILSLSKPIYSKNKKYAMVCFYLTHIPPGFDGALGTPFGIILMYKQNGKWIHIAVINNTYIQ